MSDNIALSMVKDKDMYLLVVNLSLENVVGDGKAIKAYVKAHNLGKGTYRIFKHGVR